MSGISKTLTFPVSDREYARAPRRDGAAVTRVPYRVKETTLPRSTLIWSGTPEQIVPISLAQLIIRPLPRWKRTLDLVGASVGVAFFLPLIAIIALAIKLTSRGPVFFRQSRGGLRGKSFTIYKFRTMVVGAEAQESALRAFNERQGPAFKMKDDPRVTVVGKLLRRTSLDELPQLFNVIKGEMSLVGPRPLPVSQEMGYVRWHRRRLDVKPGLTCIWQVTSRDDSDFDNWMRLDIRYVNDLSFLLDLKLLLLTIPAVLSGRGAH